LIAAIVDSAKTALERAAAWVSLHQAMGRREESFAVLREDIGFESGIPKGGR